MSFYDNYMEDAESFDNKGSNKALLFCNVHKECMTRRKGSGKDAKECIVPKLDVIDNLENVRIVLKWILHNLLAL
jgi:hypothetical protein